MAMSLAEMRRDERSRRQTWRQTPVRPTHSFDPPIRKMREIVKSGELGRLCMINTWNYNEFMYRPPA